MKFVFDDLENIFGHPQTLKGLKVYPIKVKEYGYLTYAVQSITLMKNWSEDIYDIKKDYLSYVYYKMVDESQLEKEEDRIITNQFKTLLWLTLDKETTFSFVKENNNICICFNEKINLRAQDFDEYRKIIFKQNEIKHDDLLSKDMADALEKVNKYKSKGDAPTLEEMIVSYHIAIGCKYEDVYDLTFYQLRKGLERFDMLKTFEVYTYPALKGGQQIDHWMRHVKEKVGYEDAFCGVEDISKNIE